MPLTEVKSPLASRTLWLNGLTLLVTVLTWATGVVPPEWQPAVTIGLAAVNFVLRFITTDPIVNP